nr:hypothetical protein [Tanacetum cinerariifolium]
MSASMKNLMKNDRQNRYGRPCGIGCPGDGGVSGVSLSVVSSSDDKNGEVASSGGIWPDDGSSDGSDSASDAGE